MLSVEGRVPALVHDLQMIALIKRRFCSRPGLESKQLCGSHDGNNTEVGKCHCRLPGEPGSKQNLIKSAELAARFIMKSSTLNTSCTEQGEHKGFKGVPDMKQQELNGISMELCVYLGSADYALFERPAESVMATERKEQRN